MSAWLNLCCKPCLLFLRKSEDLSVEETSGVDKVSLSFRVLGIKGCELREESLKKIALQNLRAKFSSLFSLSIKPNTL